MLEKSLLSIELKRFDKEWLKNQTVGVTQGEQAAVRPAMVCQYPQFINFTGCFDPDMGK